MKVQFKIKIMEKVIITSLLAGQYFLHGKVVFRVVSASSQGGVILCSIGNQAEGVYIGCEAMVYPLNFN